MLVIIPLGGLGSRFSDEGYRLPKPLVKAHGKEMIFHVIDNLHLTEQDNLVIIYKNDLNQYRFSDLVLRRYPKISLVEIRTQTRGAAETILYGLERINQKWLEEPVMTIDCDTFYEIDIIDIYRKTSDQNGVFCFRDTQHKPIFSYVQFNSDHQIHEIAEKVQISEYANSGCYCFRSGRLLAEYCQQTVDLNLIQKGELYISSVIRKMIHEGEQFLAHVLDPRYINCLGTPIQLKIFCASNTQSIKKQRICLDLDNTLVTFPKVPGDYTTVEPIQSTINFVRRMHQHGHTIIIHTARRMRTHDGNVGKIVSDVGKITLDTLDRLKIPYDELYFGKPYADFYIDDLAVSPMDDLEKELGYYTTNVKERDFNQIRTNKIETLTKTGKPNQIVGEVYWYQNIPSNLREYFPLMYRYDSQYRFYELEKINGVTMSYLYVNQSLSVTQFDRFLEVIDQIHDSRINQDEMDKLGSNLYKNYADKITERYNSYDYSVFPNAKEYYETLIDYFRAYEQEESAETAVIHGDPVFSNCIIDNNHNFKLIDMRGQQGDTLTILGDKWYDYGKIYQSLLGYDEILLDKIMSIGYKHKMQVYFEKVITEKFGKDAVKKIKMIANSLLFSLIPLHDNERCFKYYNLIKF